MSAPLPHAAVPPQCDCLNVCGDDNWLYDGRAEPCDNRKKWLADQEQRRQDIAYLTTLAPRMRNKEAAAALKRILERLTP